MTTADDLTEDVVDWSSADAEFIEWLKRHRFYVPESYQDRDPLDPDPDGEVELDPKHGLERLAPSERERYVTNQLNVLKQPIVDAICIGSATVRDGELRFTPRAHWPYGTIVFGSPKGSVSAEVPRGFAFAVSGSQTLNIAGKWAQLPDEHIKALRKLDARDAEVLMAVGDIFRLLFSVVRRGRSRQRRTG